MIRLFLFLTFCVIFHEHGQAQTWQHYTACNTSTSISGLVVSGIAFDHNGNALIATDGGFSILQNGQWLSYEDHRGYSSVLVDRRNIIWARSSGDTLKRMQKELWNTISLSMRAIAIDASGLKWLVDQFGLMKYGDGVYAKYWVDTIANPYFGSLAIDRVGNKWIGSYSGNHGLFRYNGTWTKFTTKDGLVSNIVTAVAVDRNNSIWVGTKGGGISKFDGTKWDTINVGNGLLSNTIANITVDSSNNIWVGSTSGLSKFDGQKWINYTTQNGLPNNSVNCVAIDSFKNTWVGTNNGVAVLDSLGNWAYYKPDGLLSNTVYTLSADYAGNILTGYSSSLNVTKFDGTKWRNYHLGDALPTDIELTADNQGYMWAKAKFSSRDSLYRFNDAGCERITTLNGYKISRINQLTSDYKGNVWICKDSTLCKFDGNTWTFYTHANGESFSNVKNAVFNKDTVWFFSNKIWKFNGSSWLSSNITASKFTVDSKSVIWSEYRSGFKKYEAGTELFYNYPVATIYCGLFSMPDSYYMTSDRNGYTWFSGIDGDLESYGTTRPYKYLHMSAYNSALISYPLANFPSGVGIIFAIDCFNNKWFIKGDNGIYKLSGNFANNNTLEVSSNEIVAESYLSGHNEFKIKSNTSWQLSCDSVWISNSQGTGSGDATIDVFHSSYNDSVPRWADIVIMGDGVAPIYVRIKQPGVPTVKWSYSEHVSETQDIYPNPSADCITVDNLNINEITLIELYSEIGSKLKVWHAKSTKAQIDISGYKSGKYLLKVSSDSYSYVKQIIKN